jgi:hypothetical protein
MARMVSDVRVLKATGEEPVLVDLLNAYVGKPQPLRHPLAGPVLRLDHWDPPLALQLGLSPNGKVICTGLLVGWQLDDDDPARVPLSERTPVTPSALHGIGLGAILNDLSPLPDEFDLDAAVETLRRTRKTGPKNIVMPLGELLASQVPVISRPHPGPKGHDNKHFKMVATEYKKALAAGRTIKWLAHQLGCSEQTLYRWLNEAEQRGFLPERSKGARRAPRRKTSPPPKRKRAP